MVGLSTNLRMLLQSYTTQKKTAVNNNTANSAEQNTTVNNQQSAANNTQVNNAQTNYVKSTSQQIQVSGLDAVNKVNTTFNTNSSIFKSTALKNLYNNLLMVNKINYDSNGRVADYEKEFLETYKSEITSTLYNKIVKNADLTEEDLAIFEQGIGKLSDSDQKLWKSEINSIRNQIKTSIKNSEATFTGVKDGILYMNGSVFSGTYTDGKLYQNGTLVSGDVNGRYYENGTLFSGTKEGVLYKNGTAYTGLINGKKYENGVPVEEKVEEVQPKVEEPKAEEVEEEQPTTPQVEKKDSKEEAMSKLGLNGELDTTFKQGGTGDCWVLSSLISLNTTEEGKQIIKDAIGVDEDGNATVTFKGINKTYTITKEEIAKYDTDNISNDAFSNGDNDALVLEIAAAKLRVDLANGTVSTPVRLYNYNNGETSDLSEASYAGYSAAMLYFMTGKQSNWTYTTAIDTKEEVYATLKKALKQAKKGDTAMTFSLGAGTNTALLADGSTYSVNIKTGHAFAVTDLNDKTITIVNPWDSSKEYEMTWEEFASMNITQFAYLGL